MRSFKWCMNKSLLLVAFITAALYGQSKPDDATRKTPTMLDVTHDAVQYERAAAQAKEELKRLEKELNRHDREARKTELDRARKAAAEVEGRLRDAESRGHSSANRHEDAAATAALEEADRLDQEFTEKRKELRHAEIALNIAQAMSDPARARLIEQVEKCRATIDKATAVAKDLRDLAASMDQSEKRKEMLRQMKSLEGSPASKGEKQ